MPQALEVVGLVAMRSRFVHGVVEGLVMARGAPVQPRSGSGWGVGSPISLDAPARGF